MARYLVFETYESVRKYWIDADSEEEAIDLAMSGEVDPDNEDIINDNFAVEELEEDD